MRTYCIAQGIISNLFRQNMIEDSMRTKMYIYVWLGHYAVQQKLTQHCKLTITKKEEMVKKNLKV